MTLASGRHDTRLELSIRFDDRALIAVAGELDVASAPDFAALLDAVIDRGHVNITIDCSELSFIGASGVGLLAAAHARLLRTDGEIRIRGASPMAYRVFEITDLLDVLHVERRDLNTPSKFSDAAGGTDPIARQATRLAADAARADALAAMLSRMTVLIPEIITACDGASVTLRRPDYLMTAAASDNTARDLDNIQYADQQGPCLEAATRGVQIHADALASEERWQAFTPQARRHGMESILSSPLLVDDQPTGALNLYSRTPYAFLPIHHDLAKVLAAQTAMLLHDPDATTGHEFDERINDALASRDVIAQAQGVIMERHGVDARDAYVALRRASVRTSIPLRRGAGDIVAGTQPGSTRSEGTVDA